MQAKFSGKIVPCSSDSSTDVTRHLRRWPGSRYRSKPLLYQASGCTVHCTGPMAFFAKAMSAMDDAKPIIRGQCNGCGASRNLWLSETLGADPAQCGHFDRGCTGTMLIAYRGPKAWVPPELKVRSRPSRSPWPNGTASQTSRMVHVPTIATLEHGPGIGTNEKLQGTRCRCDEREQAQACFRSMPPASAGGAAGPAPPTPASKLAPVVAAAAPVTPRVSLPGVGTSIHVGTS
jgi:hypothetical protein